MNWHNARRIRKLVQFASLALFVSIVVAAGTQRNAFLPYDIFFRVNPLASLTTMLSERSWIPRLGWALFTILVTLLVGRVWCGWICPLGTLIEWTDWHKRIQKISTKWKKIKYILLVIIIGMALFGNLTLLALDPLAILTRTFTTFVLPALNYSITEIEKFAYQFSVLQPGVDWLESVLRGSILPIRQFYFKQNIWIVLLILGILASNAIAARFWCSFVCPLGALLGIFSRFALFRPVIGDGCTHCARCATTCKMAAIQSTPQNTSLQSSECTVCLDCLVSCKISEIQFNPAIKPEVTHETSISRRTALKTLAFSTAGVLLLRASQKKPNQLSSVIRPPGAQDESAFLSACLRCASCMRVCPTNALQPAGFEASLEGVWTPLIIPRVGNCDYGCNACGQVCPSGAIPALSLETKRQQILGKASIDRKRCLPWASQIPCIVCEEMCPTPQKAIHLEEIQTTTEDGLTILLQRPTVDRELCIGCGICENRCPLEGEAAIRVYGNV